MASTIPKMSAEKKPEMVTPGTMAPATMMRSVLTTRAKRPRVTTESGSVRAKIIGRMKVLMAASTMASTKSGTMPAMLMPGRM